MKRSHPVCLRTLRALCRDKHRAGFFDNCFAPVKVSDTCILVSEPFNHTTQQQESRERRQSTANPLCIFSGTFVPLNFSLLLNRRKRPENISVHFSPILPFHARTEGGEGLCSVAWRERPNRVGERRRRPCFPIDGGARKFPTAERKKGGACTRCLIPHAKFLAPKSGGGRVRSVGAKKKSQNRFRRFLAKILVTKG